MSGQVVPGFDIGGAIAGHLRRCAALPVLQARGASTDGATLAAAVRARVAELRRLGVAAGEVVACEAGHRPDTVAWLLACMQAGVVWMPLDASYPPARLATMLADARPRVLVDSCGRLPPLPLPPGTVRIDGDGLSGASDGPEPTGTAGPDYLLFTSGSSGTPKGVAMRGAVIAHLIGWHAAHPVLGRAARTLQFAPLTFDVSVQEILSTLATGGVLVLPGEDERRDPYALLERLVADRVERLFLPYVALQALAEAVAAGGALPVDLRDVVTAGEQLRVTPAIRALFRALPNARLHNHYGPTEAHVVTAHTLEGDPAGWAELPSIGSALPHVRLRVVDAALDPLPGGEEGELLLGGDCLAAGYLGRPELTAERFVERPDGRWYRSGDRARLERDGTVTWLGRLDDQLKIDGYRIEPAGIEAVLSRHPAVAEVAVVAAGEAGRQRLVAHVVPRDATVDDDGIVAALRRHAEAELAGYQRPQAYVLHAALPLTGSGKIDRRTLAAGVAQAPLAWSDDAPLVDRLAALWQQLLGVARVPHDANVFDLGARSLTVVRALTELRRRGYRTLRAVDLYEHPTVHSLARRIEKGLAPAPALPARRARPAADASGVAIVGMAGRFPAADSIDALWALLREGREGLTRFAPEQISAQVPETLRGHPRYVPVRGVMADADRFDAAFFGVPAREALLMDPQQRVFLELCWNALEDAGIDPARAHGAIGVYAGSSNNSYRRLVDAREDLVQAAGEFAAMLANEKDYLATRVAHRLDLTGPALNIQTACSTSLVAVAQAWHALMGGQCDVALAGGVHVPVPQESGYLPVEGGMESSDGHCRPFDAAANGTVFSAGAGVVVLKRVADALADGDRIVAVIRGVGLNNDGAGKASFTAPSVRGQADAIAQALACAGVTPDTVGYVEAHGTATPLGDPIEVAALNRAYGGDGAVPESRWLGSLKGHLGHLNAASGVAGLIKAALALQHGELPPTLHYRTPNPEVPFAEGPFRVVAECTPWSSGSAPRRAGVSSFGVGGTNAHVILEEAPAVAARDDARPFVMLPVSARDEAALARRGEALAEALAGADPVTLADAGWTLAAGRQPMAVRAFAVADRGATAAERLRALTPHRPGKRPRVVFLFSGQGSQHAGMARELVASEPVFAEAFTRCCALASAPLGLDLAALILDGGATADAQLAQTRIAQPALFAVSYALAELWEHWGVIAEAMIGHSIGEYVAACRAGVFALEDAMALVVARGAAMQAQPPGAMLAVRCSEAALPVPLPEAVSLAAVNGPSLVVVAGPQDEITGYADALAGHEVASTALKVSHAFHSAMMDGALPPFRAALEAAPRRAPTRPFHSSVSGAPITPEDAVSADYWCRQLRRPVRFADAVAQVLGEGEALLLEVGPAQALTSLARTMLDGRGRAVPSLGPASRPGDAREHLLRALGECWCAGIEPDWSAVYAGQSRRTTRLPGYPFAGERYWITPDAATTAAPSPPTAGQGAPIMSIPTPAPVAVARRPRLAAELRALFERLTGEPLDARHDGAAFLDLGLDSLALTQATLEIERRFGVKLKFRRLMEDLDTVDALAGLLDAGLPPEAAPAPAPMPALLPTTTALPVGDGTPLAQLIQSQTALLNQQAELLRLLAGQGAAPVAPAPAVVAPVAAPVTDEEAAPANLVARPFGASARIVTERRDELSDAQRTWLARFVAAYTARTRGSRDFSQQHRVLMADPRVVTGFNPLWKELTYPIVAERSEGARLWDVDGNEYIDLLNGFGVNFLGYQPKFVVDALHAQLDTGMEIGPQHPLTAEVAQLISELTGMPRVAFCNTGSEAVMGAMRMARTVTGRQTIVVFRDSYHGIFDEVIVRGTRTLRSIAAAPGILASAVENVLVLDYGSDEALRIIGERAHELAAVLVEPVQSKHPTRQPQAFLQALRGLCDRGGCALIFDEVITGFRMAPGGAQEAFGVRADIATYGKIIGGGLPFAAIAGAARWMDALDGGFWRFGDDSYPEAGVTYFAGTFVHHPLALAAARAALRWIKAQGPQLQAGLNARTRGLIDRLNAVFAARRAPVTAVGYSSLWKLVVDDGQPCASLLYYRLRHAGLHLFEQFNCFLSVAHGEAEVERIVAAVTESVDDLLEGGVLLPRGDTGEAMPAVAVAAPAHASIAGELPAKVPLSDAQMGRWLGMHYNDAIAPAFNESTRITFDGALDVAALERAFDAVVARHDIFAMRFAEDGSGQAFVPPSPVRLAARDLSMATDPEAALDAWVRAESARPFDTLEPPLLRAWLVKLAADRHVLLMVAHHIVMDGWSLSLFLRELALGYNAFRQDRAPAWPPADAWRRFVLDEHARRDGAEGRASLDWWLKQYRTLPDPLALPLDRSRPRVPRFRGATFGGSLDANISQGLREAARAQRVTLFALLLGGFYALLQRLSGQDDLICGIPFAGQAASRFGQTLGDADNTLPLRMAVDPAEPFGALVKRVQAALLDAGEHQDISLARIAQALKLPRDTGRLPMTEVLFNFNPATADTPWDGVAATHTDLPKTHMNWDIEFHFNDHGGRLDFLFHYNPELFDATTVERWSGYLGAILREAAAWPERAIGDAPLMDEAERRQVLEGWNDTDRPPDRAGSLVALVEASMRRGPERTAVSGSGVTMDYATLDASSRAVARALGRRGFGRGDHVGVCVPRTVEMLVAVLGVLRSGAAYVPLDPEFPPERLRYMADKAGVAGILCGDPAQVPAALAQAATLLPVAQLGAEPDDGGELPAVHGDDLAYVLFTSGSTGQPKGVRILHRNLVNFLRAMQRDPGFGADDVLCAVTTLSFDIAGLELYLPLIAGGQVVIATALEQRDPRALCELIERSGCTVLQSTPSLLKLMEETGQDAVLARLRLLVGGEALPLALARSLAARGRGLWNLYGPTETTIWSTVMPIGPDVSAVPLGRPIDNTRIYVLDRRGQPVPPGVIGEIVIAGDGVADGYLGEPALTAERFVPEPFHPGGGRMYRTGDLGAWRDGVLYFHGRVDHQIKIRGFRIEPGDIEAAAGTDPAVRECVVVAQRFGENDLRLVLYATADGDPEQVAARLRRTLRERLPAYMQPQHVELLDALPKTANGKIDRKALPAPSATPTAIPAATATAEVRAEEHVDPRQAYLARLWCELIGIPSVRGSDNFFDVGGHSLLAVTFTTRVQRETGARLNLLDVATAPLAVLATTLPATVDGSGAPAAARSLRERVARWLRGERASEGSA
ncbi:MAG TPA: amino acid adenylation domain-containing protein [Dyella sp.]|nr:amino acid adenylation domain-containing protein [Dyella sp.]